MPKPIKRYLKTHFPRLFRIAWPQPASGETSVEATFTKKFYRHQARNMDSLSGPGSDLAQTAAVRRRLPELLREFNCSSLLDLPCGDFYWMNTLALDIDYVGGDIVAELIERNQRQFQGARRRFLQLDLQRDELPASDLVLCRDCLVHFSNRDIVLALENIKRSGCRYLLTTTFVDRDRNSDIVTGKWRPLNLQRPPFALPAPIELIDEAHPVQRFRDKHLGLWRIDDIPAL
jgi:SAM-dependent methyltransferase